MCSPFATSQEAVREGGLVGADPDPFCWPCAALTSAIIDKDTGRHYPCVLLDSDAPELFKKKLNKLNPKDPTIKKAFMEVLDKGKVPLPDRIAENVSCSKSALAVVSGNNSLTKVSNGARHLLVAGFLVAMLLLVIFWPKDLFPRMAEPKLDAWLASADANAPVFLSMGGAFAGEENVPLRVLALFATMALAGAYSLLVLLSPSASYKLALEWEGGEHSCNLTFTPSKAPVRHGEGGVVRTNDGADMFYYFCPSNKVTGTVTLDGKILTIAKSTGWYDHEFGERLSV